MKTEKNQVREIKRHKLQAGARFSIRKLFRRKAKKAGRVLALRHGHDE